MPIDDFQALYGPRYFAAYENDARRQEMYRQELARLRRYIPDGGKALDIGCGLGDFLMLLGDKWEKYGVEVSHHATAECERRGIKVGWPGCEMWVNDLGEFDQYKTEIQFDLVIFRGSIQHLSIPEAYIDRATMYLADNGILCFLATPNAGSLCYRLWQDLPMLHPDYNYTVYSDKQLCNILRHWGYEILDVHYPYEGTPYADPERDQAQFIHRVETGTGPIPCWPGNMMEIYCRRPPRGGHWDLIRGDTHAAS